MSIQLNKVTWYSKLLAFILLVIVVPTLFFLLGAQYTQLKVGASVTLNSDMQNEGGINNIVVPEPLKLTGADTGKMLTVDTSQIIEISLPNPGDGGYTFDNPEFDTSLIHLNNHYHNAPATKNPGDFGNDVWQFVAIRQGVTDITIIASRPWDKGGKSVIFRSSFGVK
jgi:predicted secreted protein